MRQTARVYWIRQWLEAGQRVVTRAFLMRGLEHLRATDNRDIACLRDRCGWPRACVT
jgi:hypothetical protein